MSKSPGFKIKHQPGSRSCNSNSDSFTDNASTYDVCQLLAKATELKKEPVRFVNAQSFKEERDKRLKLKRLYSEQA